MSKKPEFQVRGGDIVAVAQLAVVTNVPGKAAVLKPPRGRHLVVAVLGVTDPGVEFDVGAMLGAMGYVKKEETHV